MDSNGHSYYCPDCNTRMLTTFDWGFWAVCTECDYAECLEKGYYPAEEVVEESTSVLVEEKKEEAAAARLSPMPAQSLI